jgi:hypothetical protein
MATPSDLLPDEQGGTGASPEDGFDEEAFRLALSQGDCCDPESPLSPEAAVEEPQTLEDIEPAQHAPLPPSTTSTARAHRPLRQPADVLYTHYPFLRLGNMSSLSARDVNVLEAESCLRVPTRDALEEFLRQYFRHVHPLLPLIHEGEFWIRYARRDLSEASGSGVSLMLLQAMLFAACNVGHVMSLSYQWPELTAAQFVSLDIIQSCGLGSMREARAELYRRAKV